MNITFVINAHREGLLLHPALRSAKRAQDRCQEAGLQVQIVLIVDQPNDETKTVVESWVTKLDLVKFVSFGNLGASRNAGIDLGTGEYLCFLDGDDVWQPDWPLLAYQYAQSQDINNTIYHTEVFAAFGQERFLRKQISTEDFLFHPNHLVAQWLFCNNLFCHHTIFQRFPIQPYDHANGFGSEDWHWSCQTCEGAIARRYVPNTVYFYRVDEFKPSLGRSPFLALRETDLFRRDSRVAEYTDFFGTSTSSTKFLEHAEALQAKSPVPGWLMSQVHNVCDLDADIWSLRRQLGSMEIETPRLYVSAAAVFSEMRKLWDAHGEFGIVFLRMEGREAHTNAKLLLTLNALGRQVPLVVGVDQPFWSDSPFSHDGRLLYIDLLFLLKVSGDSPFALRQLFSSAIVQFHVKFVFSVEHWFGTCLSVYRSVFEHLAVRYGYVGFGNAGERAWHDSHATAGRILRGGEWYNEIWLGGGALPAALQDLGTSSTLSVTAVTASDIAEVLSAAVHRSTGSEAKTELLHPRPTRTKTSTVKSIMHFGTPRVTCILNVHRERETLLPTLRSVSRMIGRAGAGGITTSLVIVCDDSDASTKHIVDHFVGDNQDYHLRVVSTKCRDLGQARNCGISEARGEFVALLDGDDLFSENWITAATTRLERHKNKSAVIHPELNVYFGQDHRKFWHPAWGDPAIGAEGLLFENYWTSLSFARRELYLSQPFCMVNLDEGFGFEDWHWNMEVLGRGGEHLVAERTSHFIRLKEQGSLNRMSSARHAVTRPTRFLADLVRGRCQMPVRMND